MDGQLTLAAGSYDDSLEQAALNPYSDVLPNMPKNEQKMRKKHANRSVFLESKPKMEIKLGDSQYNPILKKSVNSSISQSEFKHFLQSRSQSAL